VLGRIQTHQWERVRTISKFEEANIRSGQPKKKKKKTKQKLALKKNPQLYQYQAGLSGHVKKLMYGQLPSHQEG
jgi:hypothetical protein